MPEPHKMNHDTHTYVSMSFAESSPFYLTPDALTSLYPGLTYCGQVGELSDVHLYSYPKGGDWNASRSVLSRLEKADGILHVDVQRPVARMRRGDLEL